MMPRPRPSWPRRLRRVCKFLLLGLGTTLGVVWGLAASLPMNRGAVASTIDTRHSPMTLEVTRVGRLGAMRRMWYTYKSEQDSFAFSQVEFILGVEDSADQPLGAWAVAGPDSWGQLAESRAAWSREGGVVGGLEDARGWPALACWWSATDVTQFLKSPSRHPLEVRGGIPLAPFEGSLRGPSVPVNRPRTLRALPLLPIWPGLAFDTLFYALLWWLAFTSVRVVKHNRRYRRGLCPTCRYDLRADYSQGCSECGWGKP